MANKALDRKPYAENPHARFDEGSGAPTKPRFSLPSDDSLADGCGCLVVIIILGIFKSAGISWLTHGKYGWTLGKSISIFSGIAAGIILLAAIGIGIAGVIDWLKMKRAKQGNIRVGESGRSREN